MYIIIIIIIIPIAQNKTLPMYMNVFYRPRSGAQRWLVVHADLVKGFRRRQGRWRKVVWWREERQLRRRWPASRIDRRRRGRRQRRHHRSLAVVLAAELRVVPRIVLRRRWRRRFERHASAGVRAQGQVGRDELVRRAPEGAEVRRADDLRAAAARGTPSASRLLRGQVPLPPAAVMVRVIIGGSVEPGRQEAPDVRATAREDGLAVMVAVRLLAVVPLGRGQTVGQGAGHEAGPLAGLAGPLHAFLAAWPLLLPAMAIGFAAL